MFTPHFNERPRTTFRNLYEPRVLVDGPPRQATLEHLRIVVGSTWAEDIADALRRGDIRGLFAGSALWQGLEFIPFFVTIQNVTRIFTHQLVRMRIGATYSQQCSGDMDWRHQDALVPPSIAQCGFDRFAKHVLQAKIDYASLVDLGISVQEARYLLPQCLSTFISMQVNLAALVPWIEKRTCVQTQSWEMIVVAREVKRQVVAMWPEFAPLFPDKCAVGQCFWAKAIKAGDLEAHTNLYMPGSEHPEEFADVVSIFPYRHIDITQDRGIEPVQFVGMEKCEK